VFDKGQAQNCEENEENRQGDVK